jgi:hypothetical protein
MGHEEQPQLLVAVKLLEQVRKREVIKEGKSEE